MARVPNTIRINYSPPGWATKRGKPQGRPTCDFSRKNSHGFALNTDGVKETVKAYYGAINPVQIDELMLMVISQANRPDVGWSKLCLWKMDLSGAFNLLYFRPEDTGLLAMEMSGALTMISLVGSFGHQSTAFAFEVVSRVLVKAIRAGIKGGACIYTDDVMGCCAGEEVDFDTTFAGTCARDLLGPTAVAVKKWERGRTIDFIGWNVDLEVGRLGIARHNFLKALYGFCSARIKRVVSVRELMRLGSFASRYCMVCRYMRPFSGFIYARTVGRSSLDSIINLDNAAETDCDCVIGMWVVFLLLMEFVPTRFKRSILSFLSTPTSLRVTLDASLTGIGIIISRIVRTGGLILGYDVIAVFGYNTPFELKGDASNQNTMEFIAEVCGMAMIISLGIRGVGVEIQGDSTTALSWVQSEKFKIGRSTAAALFYVQMQSRSENPIEEVSYIASAENPADDLSRGVPPTERGFHPSVIRDLGRNSTLVAMIQSWNPLVSPPLQACIGSNWQANERWIDALMKAGGGWQ